VEEEKEDKQRQPKQAEDITNGFTWKIMLLFAVANLGYQLFHTY